MSNQKKADLTLAGVVIVMLPFTVAASEITFTGADTSNPTNLSSAANWSAPPSADAVGVIAASAKGYVVNADLPLKGLRIETAGKEVTLGGSATLTLGGDGLTANAGDRLVLRCPVATAADQTWNLSEGVSLHTYSTISGTAALCISNFSQYVYHHSTVGYGGSITYHRSSVEKNGKWIEYRGEGKWANAVHVASAIPLNLRPGNNKDVQWTSVFPVSAPTVATSHANIGLNTADEATGGTVVFGEGADLSFATDNTTPYHLTLAGVFRQTGGSIVKRSQYFVTLGHMEEDSSGSYEKPSLYSMEGGLLNASQILIGYGYRGSSPDGCRFVQKGGTVRLPYGDRVGNVQIGGGSSTHHSIAEYRMEAGVLSLAGWGGSYNLAIASPRESDSIVPASGFIMSGGTVTSHSIVFGSDLRFWNSELSVLKNAFALLDISGGKFTLTESYAKTGKIVHFCNVWNGDPAATNCFYAVKLHGGELKLTLQTEWPLQTCFPASAEGTVLGGGDRDLVITAPVHGTGIIRKEGSGGLFLSDATRFTGTLDVRGGVLGVEGDPAGDVGAEDADCFRWTADSLLSTHAEGDPVASWTDSNNGLVATTNGNMAVEWKGFKAPVFKPDAYNGHAALTFANMTSLAVPQEMNPLYGKQSCSVVAVFKTDRKGGHGTVEFGNVLLSLFPGATHSVLAVGLVDDPADTDTGCRFSVFRRFGGTKDTSSASMTSREGVTLHDGDVHAVAFTIDKDKVTFTVDADRTVTNYTGTAAVAPFGYQHAGYGRMERAQLNIGGHIIATSPENYAGRASFIGDLMEIRVYTNRLFTAGEQRMVTKKLLRKYDGTPARMARLETEPNSTGMGVPGGFTSWTPPAPVAADASWDADSVAGEDGAAVSVWTSEDGSLDATTGVSGKSAPTLVKNAVNGHAALRFSAEGKTALGLAAAYSPVSDADDFTVAVVWKSSCDGKSDDDSLYHEHTASALLSTKRDAPKSADFTLTYRPGGAVMAGYGHENGDQSFMTRKPYRLDDGEVHISVLSCSGTDGTYRLMTDGVVFSGSLENASKRGAFDVLFGACRSGLSTSENHFDGDIAAVKMYGSALTESEMRGLSEHWAEKYATHLLASHPYAAGEVRETGLSATNVIVAAGAVLSLPLTDETPFTLGNGSRLSGSGRFTGSYRFASGSTFDLTGTSPESFDDLQMSGGSIRVNRGNFSAGDGVTWLRRLKVSGANTVHVDGSAQLPKKTVLFAFEEMEIDPAATWTVSGAGTTLTTVKVDADAGCVLLETRRGLVIGLR